MFSFSQGLNWETIKVVLDTQKSQIIDQIKKKLYIIYMDLVGEESKAVLDDTAAYLFKIFLDEKMVLQKHFNQMKQLYGTVNTSQIHEIFRVSSKNMVLGALEYKDYFAG